MTAIQCIKFETCYDHTQVLEQCRFQTHTKRKKSDNKRQFLIYLNDADIIFQNGGDNHSNTKWQRRKNAGKPHDLIETMTSTSLNIQCCYAEWYFILFFFQNHWKMMWCLHQNLESLQTFKVPSITTFVIVFILSTALRSKQ